MTFQIAQTKIPSVQKIVSKRSTNMKSHSANTITHFGAKFISENV